MSSHAGRKLALALAGVIAVTTLFPGDALAARRRAVRSGPGTPTTPGGGGCVTYGLIPPGLVTSYRSVTTGGTVNYTITYLSDTGTQTKTTQKVTTPQGTGDAVTTIDQEIVNGLRATKHVDVTTTLKVSGFSITTEVDMDFSPSMEWGPAQGWCAGAKWTVSPVTITTVAKSMGIAQPAVVTSTLAQTGEILSTNESVTVPAGTFSTVKYRGVVTTDSGATPAIVWMSKQYPITIRQDTLDAGGNVTSTTELTAISGASVLPVREVESVVDPGLPAGTN